jgi:hypothetical protein
MEAEKHHIVHTLESQSTIRGVSTELAIQVGQNKVAAKVPKVYKRLPSCLAAKHRHDFRLQDPGIMQ